jgi:hypothetical protein
MSSADPIDQGCEHEQNDRDLSVAKVRAAAALMEKGQPGTCISCGYDFTRLVRGRCGKCRDELGLL